MSFLSKLVEVLASPLTWAFALVLVGIVRGRGRLGRHRRAAVAYPLAGLLVLWVFAIAPISNALYRGLETDVSTARDDVVYDAVILLGGLLDSQASESHGTTELGEPVERLLAPFELARAGRARFVLVSGGSSDEGIHDAIEARVLAAKLALWGIEPERIVIEDQSRTTHENAVESAAIVRERGWQNVLLVTSAFHMPRAAACFRAEGLAVDVLPVDFRTYDPARFRGGLVPRAERLAESTTALREYVKRVVYRVRGFTKD